MAINLGSAYGKVSLDASGIKSGVASGMSSLKNLQQAGLAIGGGMQKIGGLMTLGLTVPIVAFFKASVDSAVEAESVLAELNAVLKSTGGAAGVTADEIEKMAAELQKVTKFSDDEIMSGQSMLLTFTKIGKDVFPMATEAMLNMAEKFGSIESASVQLGKALNDPIQGVTALRRVGVMLTDEQEDQIKAFMAVNDIASAQNIILKELEVEFGGLAKAAGDTTAGKMAQLTNAFDDMKEVVGGALIPMLLPLIAGLTKMVETFSAMPPFLQKTIMVLLALVALAGPVLMFIGTIISAISSISAFVTMLGGLGITLPVIGAALGTVGAVITGTLLPAIGALLTALAPILLVLAAIAIAVGILYLAWKYNIFGMRDVINGAILVMKKLWQAFMAFLQGDTATTLTILQELLNNFKARLSAIFDGLSGFQQAWSNFMNFLRTSLTRVREYISSAFTNVNWGQIGKNILSGLANGMLLGIPSLIAAAAKAAAAALTTIKNKLGIHSDSTVFEELGLFSGRGYQSGLRKSMNPDDIARMMARPVNNMANSNQQNITMQFAGGLTTRQVSSMIAENNEQIMNTLIGALGGA